MSALVQELEQPPKSGMIIGTEDFQSFHDRAKILVVPLTKASVADLDDKLWEVIHGHTECGARRASQLAKAIREAVGITL